MTPEEQPAEEINDPPMFITDIGVHAGMLEELTSFPDGETGEMNTEMGLKLFLGSYDDEDQELGGMTVSTSSIFSRTLKSRFATKRNFSI